MIKTILVYLLIFFCMVVTTGCMDRRELNDIAIVLGWGMDQKEDGTFVASAQIAIPSKLANGNGGGGGGAEDGYLLEPASGKSASDAGQNMQLKLSRVIFASHRRVIILG